MKVPSGQVFSTLDLQLLPLMAKYKFIDWRDAAFKLKSGIESHVYVFGREDVTDHPDLEWLLGRKMGQIIISPFPDTRFACPVLPILTSPIILNIMSALYRI